MSCRCLHLACLAGQSSPSLSLSRAAMDSAPKKLDAVDRWRARVLFRDPLPASDSWSKRMERQMAVLRVSFPFLTEKQLRGKAWTACGLRSLMGELPRSGLSPKVKREFMKQGKDERFNMSPKSMIKKEPINEESKLSTYSHELNNCGAQIFIPPNNTILNDLCPTSTNSLIPTNLSPIHKTSILSIDNASKSLKKKREKRKLKPKKVKFDLQENPSLISQVSWKENRTKARYEEPYCSQISKEKTVVVQSLDRYIPDSVGECPTTTQSEASTGELSELISSSQFTKKRTSIVQSIDRFIPDSTGECSIVTQSEASTGELSDHVNCSQFTKKNTSILQSIDRYTPDTIEECSTAVETEPTNSSNLSIKIISDNDKEAKAVDSDILQQSQSHEPNKNELNNKKSFKLFNKDSGSTFFNCNLPNTPENYWSQPMLTIPIIGTNIEDSNIISKDPVDLNQIDKKSENEEVIKNSFSSCMKRTADSLSQNSINNNCSSTRVSFSFSSSGELTIEGLQSSNSVNFSQNEEKIPFILTPNYSLPSTPQEPILNYPLLSDLCCEYDKACSKQEYKPIPQVNYHSIARELKEDFDKIIPPEVSLVKYFEADDQTYEEIQSEVHDKVNNILLALETEISQIDN